MFCWRARSSDTLLTILALTPDALVVAVLFLLYRIFLLLCQYGLLLFIAHLLQDICIWSQVTIKALAPKKCMLKTDARTDRGPPESRDMPTTHKGLACQLLPHLSCLCLLCVSVCICLWISFALGLCVCLLAYRPFLTPWFTHTAKILSLSKPFCFFSPNFVFQCIHGAFHLLPVVQGFTVVDLWNGLTCLVF